MPREYRHIKMYEKEIFELKEQGLSQRQIAEKLGFSYKKMHDFFRKEVRTSVKYMAIYRHKDKYSISEMCRFFKVSRSGYYDTVIDFDTVNFDYYYQGNSKSKGVIFKKTFEDGKMQSFEIVSNKKRTLNLQTLYMESGDYQKKKSAETLLMDKPSANAQGAGRSDSTNKVPQSTENVKENSEKFSMRENVEEIKDLIAVHNMQTSKLEKSLALGGLPMPSIAIIKAKNGHSEYGDVSLVFNKDTIDPQLSKDNKVYGGDAWTPTYPTIEYKANEKVAERISKLYYDFAKKYGYDEARPLYNVAQDLEDELNRHKGEVGLIDYYKDDTRLMNLYLIQSGKGKIEPIMKETRTELSEAELEECEYLVNALGEDIINEIKADDGGSPMSRRKAYFEKNGSKIETAYKKMLSEMYDFSEEQIQNVISQTKLFDYAIMINSAYKYLHNETVTVKVEEDSSATKEAIRNAASEGYFQWLDDLFKGAEEKSGIRNNVDYFTPMGNRRSFEATHWENNLENVVRAMKSEEETGGGALISGLGIYGVSAKKYKSIDEIKADSDRLTHISEDEYKEIKRGFGERLGEIANSIMDKTESNPFIANDNACECIVDAIRNSKTKSGILNNLKQYRQLNVTETNVDDIVSLVSDIANMPTEYFEAKPRRAVGFDEVAAAIIPDNASEELKNKLSDIGVNIIEYESGNEESRLNALNGLEDVKFSDRDYSYDTLVSKPDMKITVLSGNVPNNRADVVYYAKKNAAKIGTRHKDGSVSVKVKDIETDVIIGTKGLIHGLSRGKQLHSKSPIIVNIGEILSNSIRVNEANPKKDNAERAYVLIGYARDKNGNSYITRSIVNRINHKLESVDVLYAVNIKKESAVPKAPRVSTPSTDSTISISNLLDVVNRFYPEVLSEDVLKHYGHTERPAGNPKDLGESMLFSDRNLDTDNRTLLSNALASTAQNEIEKKYIEQYQDKIDTINAEQKKLTELRAKIKELSFAKGHRDLDQIRKLRDEATKIANRINIFDKQLLKLESAKPLKEVLNREKAIAKKKAEKAGREALDAYKERAVKTQRELMDRYQTRIKKGKESRDKTELRHKIRKIADDFKKRLLNGSNTRYVPKNLVEGIISVCNEIDPTGKDQNTKVAEKYRSGKAALAELKLAYDSLKTEDYEFSSEFNEEFSKNIEDLAKTVGDTPLRDMSKDQLEDVYNIIHDIKAMLQDATKQIGTSEKISNYEAGQEVIALMQGIKGLELTTNEISSFFRNWMENPMRAVREMSAFNPDSRLVKLQTYEEARLLIR